MKLGQAIYQTQNLKKNCYKDAQGTQKQLQGTEWKLQHLEKEIRNYEQQPGEMTNTISDMKGTLK